MLLFCAVLAGCGRDEENLGEQTSEKEQGILAESEISEEEKRAAEENYQESLAAGGQICPQFPKVERLAQVDEQYLLDSICPAVVRLEDGNLFGSGIIWKMEEESIWIMTNQHMFDENEERCKNVIKQYQDANPIWCCDALPHSYLIIEDGKFIPCHIL